MEVPSDEDAVVPGAVGGKNLEAIEGRALRVNGSGPQQAAEQQDRRATKDMCACTHVHKSI
ncbi:MAG: hypothetical protein IPO79_12235 [Flavobacteriales bacterium]|nr:hypothetical protein [Flavobacteriales bacterium]